MKRTLVIAIGFVLGGLFAGLGPMAAAAAQSAAADLEVVVAPSEQAVLLGEQFDLTVEVTNSNTKATEPLLVHIDITDPSSETSVDPEDWTSTLSIPIGALEPGATATAEWTLQPISSGRFVVYSVVLTSDVVTVTASNPLLVEVTEQRTLNPDGILPVALGTPLLVGTLLIAQSRRARRGGGRAA